MLLLVVFTWSLSRMRRLGSSDHYWRALGRRGGGDPSRGH